MKLEEIKPKNDPDKARVDALKRTSDATRRQLRIAQAQDKLKKARRDAAEAVRST